VKIAVLGAGAWGSALAVSLSSSHATTLWARRPEFHAELVRKRASSYLPEVGFPEALRLERELRPALAEANLAIVATPTAGLRAAVQSLAAERRDLPFLWACKGFETGSGLLPHEIVGQALPGARAGALSGPSFALEVARGQPTALTIASPDSTFASETAAALNSPRLRIYSSADVIGVELGGALKNVIAIAAGICDGLGLGRNARAALITRGLAEIARLGLAMGGRAETFAGLTGLGDLVLTCTGELSRNREVGVRLAKGERLEAILAALGHVSEGVASSRAALAHAQRLGVDMPITEAVCAVLFDDLAPLAAVQQLLARDPRAE
jgi:glycerol-3-phosphate dehydrogenase (NAD(P)+)